MNTQDARPVSPAALVEMLAAGLRGAPRVIDLRSRAAFEAGHLPGSSRLGFDEIETPYLRPPRWRPLIVVADDAIQADDAARMLRGHGHLARGLSVGIGHVPGSREEGPEHRPVWEPSPLVECWADRIPAGEACDLACGSGRDAVYMAMRGHTVTAIDVLPDALEQGVRLAERHGVRVRFVCEDVEAHMNAWTGPWDLINVQRFLHREMLRPLRERLTGGGILLYETFLEQQARAGKKPRNLAFLLRSGELLEAAAGLDVLHYREGTTDAGDSTAALVARKGGERAPR